MIENICIISLLVSKVFCLTISGKILGETTSGIFTSFPIIGHQTEQVLLSCFNSVIANKEWLDCVVENGEDRCNCLMYHQASEKCINKYINNEDFLQMFNESTSKACNFNHTNVILDYDESEDLKILSQHPKHTKGFFDFCYNDFKYCYEDVSDKFEECLNDEKADIEHCKCRFGEKLRRKCSQYCPKTNKAEVKFESVEDELCRFKNKHRNKPTRNLMKRFFELSGEPEDTNDDDIEDLDFFFNELD